MKNTLALATLEGFSKWAKAGLKAFVSYDLRHFSLPAEAAEGDTLMRYRFQRAHPECGRTIEQATGLALAL